MGLFDMIFDKKNCSICGGEIGLLGNRKLVDGNLCKNCAEQLSPFMTDRRQSTVAEIRQHLAYREANKRVLLGMNPTQVYGRRSTKVYVDENQGTFFVTSTKNYMAANPDVISVAQVIGVQPTIHEDRTELYHHDREGRRVPYNPRRYQVEYRFNVKILVNAPFFNEISFEFSSDHPDSPISSLYRTLEAEIAELQDRLTPSNYVSFAPTAMMSAAAQSVVEPVVNVIPEPVVEAVPQPIANPQPAAAPNTWFCANCGQQNSGKFCTNCGTKKPVLRRCDKCGWMPEDQNKLPKFCPNCGDPFNEEDVG